MSMTIQLWVSKISIENFPSEKKISPKESRGKQLSKKETGTYPTFKTKRRLNASCFNCKNFDNCFHEISNTETQNPDNINTPAMNIKSRTQTM